MALTIKCLEEQLANLAKMRAANECPNEYLYIETGRYKPYAEATVRAAKARGYRVEKRCQGVYHIYPKAA